jgi:3-oxoacyl-[acyl-carrier protein] reductase
MDLDLDHKVFLVTGGGGGLGRATADALVAEGARVVVSGRHQEPLDRAVDELGRENAIAARADNADPDTPGRLVETALSTFGRLDGALVSVGGPAPGAVMDAPDGAWTAAFESVFLGAVRLGRTLGAHLGDGGAIAFVLSSSVKSPIAGLAISNGLRPGLAMVAKTLADELGPRGVRVNGLLPGRVDTDRVQQLDAAAGDPVAARRSSEAGIPLRRYGRPEEFGRAAAFLLSPAASYVSGVMLPVDGGALRSL